MENPAGSRRLGSLRPKGSGVRVTSHDPGTDNPLPRIAQRMAALTKEVIEIAASIVKGEDGDDDGPDTGSGGGPGLPDDYDYDL